MVEKQIVWTDKARVNFKAALSFYTERNGNERYSTQLYQDIIQSIEGLKKNAYLGELPKTKMYAHSPKATFGYFTS